MRHRPVRGTIPTALTLFLIAAVPAWSSDGALEINQACATVGGCFSGDSAGFPVTISSAGSYVLTSNLDVANANTDAIEITASTIGISIDLNGFAMGGRIYCTGFGSTVSCNAGSGRGIDAAGRNLLRVQNGTIIDFDYGIVAGDYAEIQNVTAVSNGNTGIWVGDASTVIGCQAVVNEGTGIRVTEGSVVRDSTARGNKAGGISGSIGSVVTNNAVSANGASGIQGTSLSVRENSAYSNEGHGIFANDSAILGNATNNNGADGIYVTGGVVNDNISNNNAGWGIDSGVLPNASGHGNVISDNTLGTLEPSGGVFLETGENQCDNNLICP